METSTINLPSPKEAMNEYFKLKMKYEAQINANKKKIMNNVILSKREKRSEFLKLKPKCINCKRPGGTKFQVLYYDELAKESTYGSHREYRAECGIVADPCPLDIKVQIGKVELLPDILNSMETEIRNYKNKIIDDKNQLLFGFITTEEALKNFEEDQMSISLYTELYEKYLEAYNKIVDNDNDKEDLNKTITESYIYIDQIKESVKKATDLENIQYIQDAVEIYKTSLMPALIKIRSLKYNETMVWHDEDTNSCRLIQNKYSIDNMSYSDMEDKVLSFTTGFDTSGSKKKVKKPLLIVESSESVEKSESSEEVPTIIKPLEVKKATAIASKEIPMDNPVYGQGKDGISWKIKEYNDLWSSPYFPAKLKAALRTNNEWMKKFMHSCVNLKREGKACIIVQPNELVVPPTQSASGQYDFGVEYYNQLFNKLPETLQETYLTFFKTNEEGVKDYTKLLEELNRLVANETEFIKTRGFI